MVSERSFQLEPTQGWASLGKVIPVVSIQRLDDLEPLLESLAKGGVQSIEITLRTDVAIEAIAQAVKAFPELMIGAGTVMSIRALEQVVEAGAQFALSPGFLPELVQSAFNNKLPFIPGVATASEVMAGLELGVSHFKLFPATVVGGESLLKAFYGPMPQANFCPTGGVTTDNMRSFLGLANVYAVGMTRLVPNEFIENRDWAGLTASVKSTVGQAHA